MLHYSVVFCSALQDMTHVAELKMLLFLGGAESIVSRQEMPKDTYIGLL
jgi:hypothetical protein